MLSDCQKCALMFHISGYLKIFIPVFVTNRVVGMSKLLLDAASFSRTEETKKDETVVDVRM